MAKKLDKVKVIMGQIIKVANLNKKPTENERYIALQMEDETGKDEKCLLFTESQLSKLETVKLPKSITDRFKLGRFYNVEINKDSIYLVKVRFVDGSESILRVTKAELADADARRIRNPEDLTEKGFVVDMLD